MTTKLPTQFLCIALLAGFCSSNAVVGLPLLVNASASPSSYMGFLLALLPLGTALGAFVTAPVRNRLGSAAATLSGAIFVLVIGSVTLTVSTATLALAIGMILVGMGEGIFWVCSQVLLSINSQSAGNHSAYLSQYALYTAGVFIGAALTGAFVAVLEAIGTESLLAGRVSLGLGVAASATAFLVWWPKRWSIVDAAGRAIISWRIITHGLTLQVQDLLIVSALAVVSLLAPLTLLDTFSFSPFAVGAAMGCIALSKIAGTIAARFSTRAFGSRKTVLASLITGLVACPVLALSGAPVYFVVAMFLASMSLTGIWPLIVAEAQNAAPISLRGHAAVAWNIREYIVIAASGVAGTWLYSNLGRPMMFAAAALLLTLATIATIRMPTSDNQALPVNANRKRGQ
ncbi:MFS transporter [Pseudarthrobacter sp. SSS035]|uniref:MFS transporter n=1 Tax=Pseudarthrobacter sp. SSS035 TaxID=2931399 RepID=UPI00200CDB82|nr:MFS transporter [Pseudarthrobacter sp. SSS035]